MEKIQEGIEVEKNSFYIDTVFVGYNSVTTMDDSKHDTAFCCTEIGKRVIDFVPQTGSRKTNVTNPPEKI